MKKLFITFAAITAISGNCWATGECGNDCPGGPANCDPCKKGANPFTPYSGSVNRQVDDLQMFGGVGEEKLAFRRLTTSRYKPGIPTPLGTGGSWRHNYYWNIVPAGTDQTSGGEIIHIDYPDATEHDFHKQTSSSIYLTAVSSTQERIEQSSTDANQYYLWFPDGRRLSLYKVVTNGVTSFKALGFYDKYSNFYKFDVDAKNRVYKVTEPGGRFISMTYGSIGNFPVGNVTFTYTNSSASTVSLAGEFNNWQGASNPMTNSNGTWTTTIPLQLGASYQYKFVVNGNTWVSDPNNPNTVPAGGPSTGNNSVIQSGDLNTSTSSPTPITFSYTSSTATSVAVAGSFNGWSASANQLTRNGNTWTGTISISQGHWQYKLVINGSNWQQDPSNQFAAPDGYGGYNSVLNVGPLDEAITQVQSSDGRFVTYNYSALVVGYSVYSTLVQANYSDNTAAHYTYSAPTTGSRPTLATADDPRYKGPATRVAYSYQNNGIEGYIYEEKSLVDGTVLGHLDPPNALHREVVTGPQRIKLDFSSGNPAQQFDSLNRETTYTYFDNGWGMLSSTSEHNNNGDPPYTTSYELSAQFGNITKVTLPDGKTRLTHYSSDTKPFFPDSTTDENGNTTTYTLDANGRATRIDYPTPSGSDPIYEIFTTLTDANGNTITLLSSHRMKNGTTEFFTYFGANETDGKLGDIKSKIDGAGHTTTYKYYAAGEMLSETDDSTPTAKTTSYNYNDRGQITQVTFADTKTQAFQYDPYGNRIHVTNELQKTWDYSYDQYSRPTDVTDPLQHTTHYAYDLPASGGCTSCSVENYPTSITLPSGKKTTIMYDTEWQKTSLTVGVVGTDTSEAATTYYGYDGVGNLTSRTDPNGKLWTYSYNSRKRKMHATQPVPSESPAIYTDYGYDGVGNKTSEKRSGDALATIYTYDVANRLTQVTDAKGQNTKMTYDTGGNLLTLQDPRTDQNDTNKYTYSYGNGMNRKTALRYPDGTTETWSYDNAGNVLTYKTRSGQTETLTYDNRNRETTTSWSDTTPGTTKTYFDNGLVHTIVSNVSALTYAYDDANRLTNETQAISSDSGAKVISYGYDLDNNRTGITYPSQSGVTIGYSHRNQVNSISSNGVSATYGYDLNGNRISKSLANGTSTGYSYDEASRLAQIDNQKSGTSFAKYDYLYYPVNTRASRAETVGSVTKSDAYSYDAINQVTQVRYNVNGTSQDRLVNYNYDAAGNRSGANGVSDSVIGNTNYAANNQNQYTTAGALSPTHDGNGNLHSQDGWTYTYDALNRIISASSTGMVITFAYDGGNRCVSRTTNNAVTFFYYDGWNLIEEHDGSDVLQARYIHGPSIDDLVARVAGSSIYYYHQDALGSTTALSNSSGNVTERYTYDVFGTPTFKDGSGNAVSSSASGNRFLFTGREYLQQTALYDYRNRAYSPTFGRFMQTDPLRFGARDVNLYRYVSNNSPNRRDPLGLQTPGPAPTPGDNPTCNCQKKGGTMKSYADCYYGGSTDDCMEAESKAPGIGYGIPVPDETGGWAGFLVALFKCNSTVCCFK